MKYITLLTTVLILSSCSSTDQGLLRQPTSVNRPPQFVLLAFDGSKSLDMWEETRQFARDTGVKFTYFVSGVYFVSQANRRSYIEPQKGAGKSAIGFGKDEMDISNRFRQVRDAISEGHEIASHANGHFNGASYSENQWNSELRQFDSILTDGVRTYNVSRMPNWWNSYFSKNMLGFRAPQLGHGKPMYRSLKTFGYKYDTSRVAAADYWPQIVSGSWNYPLATLRMSKTGAATLSMDYNFYFKDSKATKGPAADWGFYEEQMYETYLKYFKQNYLGNRAPIDIGHHFSKWNGGAYWKAMKRFAETVCNLPEVRCSTYSELTNFLESNTNTIASYQKGNFDKMSARDVNLPNVLVRASSKPDTFTPSEVRALEEELLNINDIHDEDVDQSIEI